MYSDWAVGFKSQKCSVGFGRTSTTGVYLGSLGLKQMGSGSHGRQTELLTLD